MASLFDNIVGNPLFTTGLGILAANERGASVPEALLGGIGTTNQFRQQFENQTLRQNRAKLQVEAIDAAARQKQQQELIRTHFGKPGTPDPNLQGPPRLGQPAPLAGGSGILADQQVTPQELQQFAGILAPTNPAVAASIFESLQPKPPVGTSLFERLQAIPEGQRTPLQQQMLRTLAAEKGGTNVSVDLKGLQGKEEVKAAIDTAKTFKDKAQRVRALDTLANESTRLLLEPGTTIGAVGGMIRGIEGIRSQIQQAVSNPEELNRVTSGLSDDNKRWINKAIQSGGVDSNEIALMFGIASGRETGKLTDNDVKFARDTFAGTSSIPLYISKLQQTRDRQVSGFNARATETLSRSPQGEEVRSILDPALAQFTPSPVFGLERLENMTDAQIIHLGNVLPVERLLEMMTEEESDAYVRRLNSLGAQ